MLEPHLLRPSLPMTSVLIKFTSGMMAFYAEQGQHLLDDHDACDVCWAELADSAYSADSTDVAQFLVGSAVYCGEPYETNECLVTAQDQAGASCARTQAQLCRRLLRNSPVVPEKEPSLVQHLGLCRVQIQG